MTRRIVLAVLGVIAVLLGTIAVPLGLVTAAQQRRDFSDETKSAAATVANVAEERLGDQSSAAALHRVISALGRNGDRVAIFDRAGNRIDGTAPPLSVTEVRRGTGLRAAQPVAYGLDDYVLVVAPIRKDNGGRNLGVVALARPTATVDHRVAVLWALIAAVAVAGLIAAALVAIGLARWVSRPLAQLEGAAERLGDGDLSTRSAQTTGPREVRSLASNFNLMATRLEALVHGHQATMADVSHQLRTPLAALRLRLELLAQDSDEQMAGELAGAQDEIRRLSRLVNGLLAVARAENMTSGPVTVAVDAAIRSRVTAWRPAAEEQGIVLTMPVLEPIQAKVGEGQLEQILDNLLANALDAIPRRGTVAISVVPRGDQARITVADNGPGMTADQKRLAFRRFATTSAGGTGLGLAIVDRLAATNGGSAALSDTAGGGLTVTIDLPAAAPERGHRRAAGSGRPGTLSRHGRDRDA